VTLRTALPRAALAAVAVATTLAPAPAQAVPPLVVQGSGVILPGLSLVSPPQTFWFTGTATTPPLTTYACEFSGAGAVGGPYSVTGTLSGSCGPYAYQSCPFTLTVSSWTLTCVGAAGTFAVQPGNTNPTTTFTATGTIS
jgi:hypothetical protein